MNTGDKDASREIEEHREGPYEVPALEPEQGYWAGRWVECKRLFGIMWREWHAKEQLIFAATLIAIGLIWGIFFPEWRWPA